MASLTRAEAIDRAALIHVEAYRIDFDLTRGENTFRSTTTITFTCTEPGASTFVDVKPRALRSVSLNGIPVDTARLSGGRVPLAGLSARNELVVHADMAYTNTGQGLHRFVDPADGLTYVYGQMFLDEAPTVFACFDQPDLKAPFAVGVTADPQWSVAGNGAETLVAPGRWELAVTKPLATYFVTLIAGPYHHVRAEHDGIPLALYARAALAPHLDHQSAEIFTITRNCLDRYHELFGVRYPFGKYDQAFVPEFTVGAMENPGCVTFRDEYIFTSAVTEAEREQRAIVIAHEMAHMWFGDLVTMRWWDDLWLNESFAEYLGNHVTAEVTAYTRAWTTFSVGRKMWGYAADQRPSTHPVSGDVADAAQALLNFDGISYAKGASVLRQLVALLGDDAFFAGLRDHFALHAYGNATLSDLLDALCRSSGRDLSTWADAWLRTAQVSTLRPEVTIGPDGRYASVDIRQAVPESHPVLRPHRLRVATYRLGTDGTADRHDAVELDIDPQRDGTRTPVTGLIGRLAADLLLINDGDLTYAKVGLDEASRDRLPALLPATPDSLTRALLWGAAWGATRDADMDALSFIDLCAAALPAEDQVAVFTDVLGYARDFAVARYLPPECRAEARARLATACRIALEQAPPGSGRQLAAVRGLVSCAGAGDVDWMRSWLTDLDAAPAGLRVDAEMRWLLVSQLATLGALVPADIDDEYARDHTASGAEHAIRARAARPDTDAKAWAWAALINGDGLSNRLLFGIASGFWRPNQEDLTASYVDRFVADMPIMAAHRSAQVAEQIGLLAYPAYAVDAGTLAKMTRMRDDESLVPGLRRSLVDETDELARSVAARSIAARRATRPGVASSVIVPREAREAGSGA